MHTYPYTAISRSDILTNDTCNTCAKRGPCFFLGATAQSRDGCGARTAAHFLESPVWHLFLEMFSPFFPKSFAGVAGARTNSRTVLLAYLSFEKRQYVVYLCNSVASQANGLSDVVGYGLLTVC